MSTLIPIIQVWPPTAGLEGNRKEVSSKYDKLKVYGGPGVNSNTNNPSMASYCRLGRHGYMCTPSVSLFYSRMHGPQCSPHTVARSQARHHHLGVVIVRHVIHNRLVVVILRHVLHIEIDVFGNRHALLQILDEVAWEQPTTRSVRGSAEP